MQKNPPVVFGIVKHRKLGQGIVLAITNQGKAQIMFHAGNEMLVPLTELKW